MKTTTVRPLPEIVDPEQRKFKVTERELARVHLQDPCVYEVPLGTARYLQDRRAHELSHIKWTPSDKPPTAYADAAHVPLEYLQAAEDCRVNTLAHKAGVKLDWLSEPKGAPAMLQLALDSSPLPTLVCLALARTGCTAESKLIKKAYGEHPKGKAALKIAEKMRLYCVEADSIAGSINAAKALQELFAAAKMALRPPELKEGSKPFPGRPSDGKLDLTDEHTLDALLSSASTFMHGGRRSTGDCSDTRWGKLVIKDPPKFTPCNPMVRGPAPRPCDSGVVPSRLHRYVSDGMIFSLKRKYRHGGSVLVDMSGSMNLPFCVVASWLLRQPMATVAVYSGYGYHGDLVILARDGRRTNTCQKMPGANVIDGPALRWLSKQPRPRFWVSDGATTGIHDQGYGKAECQAICRLFHITQVLRFRHLDAHLKAHLPCR